MPAIQQNSELWHEWRGEALGSSDAPIIMGMSEYKTPYELWLEKTGRKEPERDKFAFDMGHRAEPFIRALAEIRLGEQYEPACIRSKEYPFMQASVDGRNFDTTCLQEIKVNKEHIHDLLPEKPEAIPDLHILQMQHQLLCTRAQVCYYVSAPYRDDFDTLTPDDLHIVPIYPDPGIMSTLVAAEGEFVELLATDIPPNLMERDGVRIASASWKRNAAGWLRIQEQIKKLKEKQDVYSARLKEMAADHQMARGFGVKVTNTIVKGNIQYGKIPELKDVNMEEYRAKSYIRSTISGDA